MNRLTLAVDRLAAVVAGLLLVVAGGALFGWRMAWLPDAPDRVRSTWMTDAVDAAWWPWALAGAGILLLLLGFVWLARHVPVRAVRSLQLPGSNAQGTLTVDAGQVAKALSRDVEARGGVRTARTRFTTEQGRTVAVTTLSVDPGLGVDAVRVLGEDGGRRLVAMTGRDDVAYRAQVVVAG